MKVLLLDQVVEPGYLFKAGDLLPSNLTGMIDFDGYYHDDLTKALHERGVPIVLLDHHIITRENGQYIK